MRALGGAVGGWRYVGRGGGCGGVCVQGGGVGFDRGGVGCEGGGGGGGGPLGLRLSCQRVVGAVFFF